MRSIRGQDTRGKAEKFEIKIKYIKNVRLFLTQKSRLSAAHSVIIIQIFFGVSWLVAPIISALLALEMRSTSGDSHLKT